LFILHWVYFFKQKIITPLAAKTAPRKGGGYRFLEIEKGLPPPPHAKTCQVFSQKWGGFSVKPILRKKDKKTFFFLPSAIDLYLIIDYAQAWKLL